MNRALSTVALVCALSAVAWGQAREQIRQFSTFTADPLKGGGTLVFSDGTRFGISKETYERYETTISELVSGDRVRYTVDSRGQLSSLSVERDTGGLDGKRVVSGTFQKREGPVQGHYWVRVDAQNYKIAEETYEDRRDLKGVLFFLKPGQKVRMLVEGTSILDLARGRLDDVISDELWQMITRSTPGDSVLVNDTAYAYVGVTLHGVRLTPLDGEEETLVKLQEIKTFENRAALDRQPSDTETPFSGDAFETSGVQLGDTVGIGLEIGQLIELDPTTATLRVWRNGRGWVGTNDWPRAEVTSVRWVSLSSSLSYPLQGGNVHLRVERRRAAREDGLQFEIELSHDLPNSLLADATILLHLGKSGIDSDTTPTKTVTLEVPTLFVGDRLQLSHQVDDEALVDGYAELVAGPECVREVTGDDARIYIQQALERDKDDLNALARIYDAAATNGDPTLVGMLIDRALYPVHGVSDSDLARNALRKIAPQALERVLADLERPEHELQRTVFQDGKLRETPLARLDTKPTDHKNKLIELLSVLPGGLRERAARRLFNLHSRVDLRESVERAFASDPQAAVASLLRINTAPPTDSEARSEAERAGKLLERLAESVVEELVRELRRRGIDVSGLVEMQKSPDTEPNQVVAAALKLLAEDAKKAHLRALELTFEEAKSKGRADDWDGSLKLLREVLEQKPKHEEARKLLPKTLIAVGDQRAAAGERGRAAQLYEEAIRAGPEGQHANPKLGRIYLEVAKEELEGTAVRRMPQDTSARIRLAQPGEQFAGRQSKHPEWVEVTLTGDPAKGYVHTSRVTAAGPESWGVKIEEVERDQIELILNRATNLDPSLDTESGKIVGSLLLRDAVNHYEDQDYLGALDLFQRGQELLPDDPRLESMFWCKVHAYKVFLIAGAVLLLLILALVVFRYMQRPKKVKLEGGFQHYGKDRTKRERDVAFDSEPEPEGGEG